MLQNIHESLIPYHSQMRPELETLFESINRLLLVLESPSNGIEIPSISEISDSNWTETALREFLNVSEADSGRFLANTQMGNYPWVLGVPTYLDIENPELRKHVLAKELTTELSWWHPISMTRINNFVLNAARVANVPKEEVDRIANLMTREAYRSRQPGLEKERVSPPEFEFEKSFLVSQLLAVLYEDIAETWKKIDLFQKMFPTKKGDIQIVITGNISPAEIEAYGQYVHILSTDQHNEVKIEFNLWQVIDHRLSIAVTELDSIAQRISHDRPFELILDLIKFSKEHPIDREISSILRSFYYYDENYLQREKALRQELEVNDGQLSKDRTNNNVLRIRPDLYVEIPGGMTMGPDSLAGLVMQEKDYFALSARIKLRDAVRSELTLVGKVKLLGVTLGIDEDGHISADECLPRWLINALGFDEIRINSDTFVPEDWAKNEVKMVAKYRDQVSKILKGSVPRTTLGRIEQFFFSNYQMPRPYNQHDDLAHIMSNWSEERKRDEGSFGIIGG